MTLDSDAVPLWVGLVVFVSLVFNHSVAADADVWSGHLHSVQSDPAAHTDRILKGRPEALRGAKYEKKKNREKKNIKDPGLYQL